MVSAQAPRHSTLLIKTPDHFMQSLEVVFRFFLSLFSVKHTFSWWPLQNIACFYQSKNNQNLLKPYQPDMLIIASRLASMVISATKLRQTTQILAQFVANRQKKIHVLSASIHLSPVCLSNIFVLCLNITGPSGSWFVQIVVFYLVMKGLTRVRHVFHIHPKVSCCLLNSFILFIREHGGTKCRWVDFLLGNLDKKAQMGETALLTYRWERLRDADSLFPWTVWLWAMYMYINKLQSLKGSGRHTNVEVREVRWGRVKGRIDLQEVHVGGTGRWVFRGPNESCEREVRKRTGIKS